MYRLTLVKAWNTDEVMNYANLVSLGNPDFIEVKVKFTLHHLTNLHFGSCLICISLVKSLFYGQINSMCSFQGVTYCGTSKASILTMQNIPWHEEVLSFVQQLVDQLPDYEIAAEHEHSNCVLIANKKVSLPCHCILNVYALQNINLSANVHMQDINRSGHSLMLS